MANNQSGKSLAGSAEWAMHLTGRYPDWWEGAVFENPTHLWAAGVTNESTRDNPQRLLMGPPSDKTEWGSGMVPKDCIIDYSLSRGIADALDTVIIKFGGGGDVQASNSYLNFKSYIQGQDKWQGPTLDGVWFDEECPMDIYQEGKARTQNGQNGVFTQITFTPLKGMSRVVMSFLGGNEESE